MERAVSPNQGFTVDLEQDMLFDPAGFDEEATRWRPLSSMVAHLEYAVVDGTMYIFPWTPDHVHLTEFIGSRPKQVRSAGFIGVVFRNGSVTHREMCDFSRWPFEEISRSGSERYRKEVVAPKLSSHFIIC